MTGCRGSDCEGFTLLELLIAMVLLAATVAMVISSVRVGLRSVDKGERMIVSLERVRASVRVFESHLLSAAWVRGAYDVQAGEPQIQFSGDRDGMILHSYHSLWGGSRGMVTVQYRITDDGDGRKSLRLVESPRAVAAPREALLFAHADDIAFAYAGGGEDVSWMERWSEPERFPARVRMTVKQQRSTTEVFVAIPVAATDPVLFPGGAVRE